MNCLRQNILTLVGKDKVFDIQVKGLVFQTSDFCFTPLIILSFHTVPTPVLEVMLSLPPLEVFLKGDIGAATETETQGNWDAPYGTLWLVGVSCWVQ